VAVRRPLLAALCLAVAFCAHAQAQHQADPEPADVRLGEVSFAISCSRAVRSEFNRAVGLLHSFWYDAARRGFEQVRAHDPECAMAGWGIAMTLYPQMNAWPQPAAVAEAGEALARGTRAAESSPREAQYLQALQRFYDGFAPQKAYAQAQAYADAMDGLARHYPEDLEAQVFHALALLAATPPEDATLKNPRAAYEILAPLFQAHPDHPGIAHYLIHACDHPGMAQLALPAARHYAQIAPDAPLALHMPSHIFARLGLWPDDIRSNQASLQAAQRLLGLHAGAENRLHALEFLEYAYLQMGDDASAQAMLARARSIAPGDVDSRYPTYWAYVQARLPALLAIETRDCAEAARLIPLPGATAGSEATTLLAQAIAAAHRHEPQAASRIARRMDELERREPRGAAGTLGTTLPAEVRAWVAYTRDDLPRARALLQPLAARQASSGKGEVELPAREMLAQMLLLSGDAQEALHEYQGSFESDPNRLNALLGAGQAAELLDQPQIAAGYYRTLLKTCPAPSGRAQQALRHAFAIARSHARG